MRVIVSAAYGTWGDLAPLLQLALELVRNDHQVVIIVDGYFFDKVAANDGIRVIGLGSADAYAAALADPETRWRKPVTLVHSWMDRLKEHFELLARLLAQAPKETVIVGHSLDIAVKLIEARLHPWRLSQQLGTETKRARTVTVVLQPWMLRSKEGATSFHNGLQSKAGYPRWLKSACFKIQDAMIDFAYCPQLNAFRSELGLQPVKRVYHKWYLSKGLVLGLFPSWLAGMPADWPKQLKLVGFPLSDQLADDSVLEPELRSFLAAARESGQPVFAFALGSAPPPYARQYFATAVEACRQLGAQVVLLCTVDGVVPQPLPQHAHHASFAPFSALLPHVAVLCFNGGIGSVSEALRAGTPQLITPGRFDQPDNAERMVRLGVAARLNIADFSVARCAAALEKLRSSPSVRAACAAAAAHFAQPAQATSAAAQLVAALASVPA